MRELTPLDYEKARGLQLLFSAYNLSRNQKTNSVVLPETRYLGGLYILEELSTGTVAYPTVELGERRLRILRRNSSDGLAVTQIVDALLFLGFLNTLDPEMAESSEFNALKKDAVKQLSVSVGLHSYLAFIAPNEQESGSHTDNAEALCKKALRAIIHLNTLTPGNPAIWSKSLPLAAIDIGGFLCGELRELPTKELLQETMEGKGLGFSKKSKDLPGNWRELFRTAGLETLPD